MVEINQVYNEDCLETFAKMEDDSVDYVITSPPYNFKSKCILYEGFKDDRKDYYEFLEEVITQSLRVAKKNVFFNIMKHYYNKRDVFKLIGRFNKDIHDIIIWEKKIGVPSPPGRLTNAYEFILALGSGVKSNKKFTRNHITTTGFEPEIEGHRAIMLEGIAIFLIDTFTQEGDLIYDPFMGSGTTGMVAKDLKRDYIGSEIVPNYCQLAKDRIAGYYKNKKSKQGKWVGFDF